MISYGVLRTGILPVVISGVQFSPRLEDIVG